MSCSRSSRDVCCDARSNSTLSSDRISASCSLATWVRVQSTKGYDGAQDTAFQPGCRRALESAKHGA